MNATMGVFGNTYDLTGGSFIYDRSPTPMSSPSVYISNAAGAFSSTYFSIPLAQTANSFLLTDSFPLTPRFDPTGDVNLPSGLGGRGYFTFASQTVLVPEPSTWVMMILGFGSAGAVLRRGRHLKASAAA